MLGRSPAGFDPGQVELVSGSADQFPRDEQFAGDLDVALAPVNGLGDESADAILGKFAAINCGVVVLLDSVADLLVGLAQTLGGFPKGKARGQGFN